MGKIEKTSVLEEKKKKSPEQIVLETWNNKLGSTNVTEKYKSELSNLYFDNMLDESV